MTGWPGEQKVRWQSWDKQASYSTPVAATILGRRHVLCLTRQGLVSLDPKTGGVNFSFWFRSRVNESVNAMCPVVVDDLIFISGAYYKIGSVLLRVKPDGKSVEEVWRGTALELHWTTPIYLDGYLYACSGRNEPDARMRCVELRTGKLMWDVDESWPSHSTRTPGVYGRGSSILADGRDLPFSVAATALSLLGSARALAKKALLAQRRSSGLPGPGQVEPCFLILILILIFHAP
jgi:outer membrane protein assembly factor BamB